MKLKLISVLMVIFFLALAGVSAADENITNDNAIMDSNVSSIDNDILSAGFDENQALSSESIANASNEGSDLLSVDADENNSDEDILSQNVEDDVLSLENNNESEILASEPPSDVPVGEPTITHGSNLKLQKKMNLGDLIAKEGVFAKVKITKKDYKRYMLKTPSKKNKKLWKKYKKFQKTVGKKYKKSKKVKIKALKKKWKIDWYYGIRTVIAIKGKYCTINFVCMLYKWI